MGQIFAARDRDDPHECSTPYTVVDEDVCVSGSVGGPCDAHAHVMILLLLFAYRYIIIFYIIIIMIYIVLSKRVVMFAGYSLHTYT